MTQEAITKLRNHVESSNVSIAEITVSQGDKVKILLQSRLSTEELRQIEKKIYCLDSNVQLKLSPAVFEYNNRVLTISEHKYRVYSGILSVLNRVPGLHIEQVELNENEFTFYYQMNIRPFLNAQELDDIQQHIDSSVPDHDSIRAFGYKGQYTLYIRLKR